MKRQLAIYTIFKHPKDFPDDYVLKKDIIGDGGVITRDPDFVYVSKDVNELRKITEAIGLIRMTRHPADDPCILETWL